MLALCIACSGFYDGFYLNVFNTFGQEFIRENFTKDEALISDYYGNVNMFFIVGQIIGCLLGGFVATWCGKIRGLLIGEFL